MNKRRVAVAVVGFLALGAIGAACSRAGQTGEALQEAAAPRGVAAGPAQGSGGFARLQTGRLPAVEDLDLQIPRIGERIVKTASLSLALRKGSFDQQFQEASLLAARHGGFVASSRTSEGRVPSGAVVLRVPAEEFDLVLSELRRLGRVQREQVSGQDVTAQFVDLEARLRNWEAQESVLLRLMARARTIDDSIKVQRTLQDVQLAIEEIRGQLRVLSNQTGMATISLEMTEGVPAPSPAGPSRLARAWDQALEGFVAVIAAIVVGTGYLFPLVLIGLGLLAVLLGYRRLRPRPVPTT